jgi:hypothetical protein
VLYFINFSDLIIVIMVLLSLSLHNSLILLSSFILFISSSINLLLSLFLSYLIKMSTSFFLVMMVIIHSYYYEIFSNIFRINYDTMLINFRIWVIIINNLMINYFNLFMINYFLSFLLLLNYLFIYK